MDRACLIAAQLITLHGGKLVTIDICRDVYDYPGSNVNVGRGGR